MSFRNIKLLCKHSLSDPQVIKNFTRLYGRWSHRKPAKVILPFEATSKSSSLTKQKVIDLDPEILNKSKENDNHNNKVKSETKIRDTALSAEQSHKIKDKREETLKKRKFYLSQLKVFDDDNSIIYEKCKDNDGRVSTLLTSLKSKKDRVRSQQILVEGWRLIVDGLEAKCNLKYVVFSKVEDLNKLRPFLPKTGVKFFKIPYKEIELWSNMETSPGILGVFEMPKQNTIKRLSNPIPLSLICDNIRIPGNLGSILRAAVGAGCDKVTLTKGCVDVWDPKVLRSAAGAHFRLPIDYSLDWEDIVKEMQENTTLFIADSNAKLEDEIENEKLGGLQIPVLPYYGVQYSTLNHITVIIGGETEGISEESYRLTAAKNGMRLNIPMARGVDSLNTGMATAIIAFEIRKQLIQAWTQIKQDKLTAQAN